MANWEQRARAYARKYGIPEDLFVRQLRQESSLNPKAKSPAGARGIAQIMPFHDVRPDLPGHQYAGVHPEWDLNWAAQHDAQNLKKYGNYKDMLSVYNSGRPWKQGQGISETRNYVNNILGGNSFGSPGQAVSGAPVQPQTPSDNGFKSTVAQALLQRAATGERGPGFLMGLAIARQQAEAAASLSKLSVEPTRGYSNFKAGPRVKGAVALAEKYLGTPYVWGGSSPSTGFDCSGLLQYTWAQQGVNIPRVTYDQWKTGYSVPKGKLQPGDAVFFRPGSRGPEHVGMYIGGGRFIEAPGRGKKVRISRLDNRSDYMGARRYR